MSYEFSASLQKAVFSRLAGDPAVTLLVGANIHDAPLIGRLGVETPDHITLGEEAVRANDTKTSRGAVHDFIVTIHSGRDGFETVKRIAGAVCACLVDAPLALDAGRLVALRFLQAKAERGRAPEKRRISLKFRAVVEQDD